MKIIKDKTYLRKVVPSKKMTAKEIEEITETLTTELAKHGGIGLAANQLGLDVRACIINVINPLVLINPKVIEVSKDTIAYAEQCLSDDKSMKKPVKTIRFKSFKVETDNLGVVEFAPTANALEPWKTSDDFFNDQGMLECVCAQHEIDHLNGMLMTHSTRRYSTTVTTSKKYGRNEKVMVELPDGTTDFMKYKKAKPMLELGCKIL